jgi:hypothetical protein
MARVTCAAATLVPFDVRAEPEPVPAAIVPRKPGALSAVADSTGAACAQTDASAE